MTRFMTDQKNLREALDVKRSGYKTKVHASPFKEEIDKWIIEYRWSCNRIVNELKKKYPTYNHPSNRAIDNYRKKYLPSEFFEGIKTSSYSDEMREKFVAMFDPAVEAIKLWTKAQNVLGKALELMDKTGVPPAILNDLLKTNGQIYDIITERLAKLGISKTTPTEISITSKNSNDKETAKILKELDEINAELKRRGLEVESEEIDNAPEIEAEERIVDGDDKEGTYERHGDDVGKDTGVQKPAAPDKVVPDNGQQGAKESSDSGAKGA